MMARFSSIFEEGGGHKIGHVFDIGKCFDMCVVGKALVIVATMEDTSWPDIFY